MIYNKIEQRLRVIRILKKLKEIYPNIEQKISRKASYDEISMFHSTLHIKKLKIIFDKVKKLSELHPLPKLELIGTDGNIYYIILRYILIFIKTYIFNKHSILGRRQSPPRRNRKDIIEIDEDTQVMGFTEEAALYAAGHRVK